MRRFDRAESGWRATQWGWIHKDLMAEAYETTIPGSFRRASAVDRVLSATHKETVAQLFERTHHGLWRFALRMGGDLDTAGDLVQDTFLKALQRRLPADERAAEAWLYRTLLNRARDLHRRRKVRWANPRAAHDALAIARAPDPEAAALSRERLNRVIARLAPRRRAILLLHELEGHPVEWIATTLRIRVSTVRWHLARAKNEVRDAVE